MLEVKFYDTADDSLLKFAVIISKSGNNNLLWRSDKDSVANQSATSLVIRATGICWNQVVCKRLAGSKKIIYMYNQRVSSEFQDDTLFILYECQETLLLIHVGALINALGIELCITSEKNSTAFSGS